MVGTHRTDKVLGLFDTGSWRDFGEQCYVCFELRS